MNVVTWWVRVIDTVSEDQCSERFVKFVTNFYKKNMENFQGFSKKYTR